MLILDEPTQGIDVQTKAEVHAMIAELARQGLAIILISSELPELIGMCDRIVVLREGEVTAALRRAAMPTRSASSAPRPMPTRSTPRPTPQPPARDRGGPTRAAARQAGRLARRSSRDASSGSSRAIAAVAIPVVADQPAHAERAEPHRASPWTRRCW